MKRISRGPLGALGAAVAALSLAACGYVGQAGGATNSSAGSPGGSASASNITIAGVYGDSTDPFWGTLACGAKQEAASLGVKYQAFSSTGLDNSAFSQNFSSAQLIKPSGMFVNPSNPNQFVTQYKTLMSSGVPVVTINSSTPPAQYKVVGTGTTGNTALLQQAAGLVTADSGSMVVVNGIPGLVPVQVRLDPVVNAITSAHSGLKSLPTIYSGFDVNKATQALSTDLIAHSDLKVIVAADGPDGQAAAAAVQQAGKAGQVTVIALDATPAEVTALKAGTITGLVAQSPLQIGQDQVKELVSYIEAHPKGGAVPANAGTVSIPQHLLTKSSVDDPASNDWIYKTACPAVSAAAGASASSITIAGVYGDSTDPFWGTLACGAKQEAATLGVKYQAFSSTSLDNSAFSQNFSSAQLIKPSGMFVNPANPNQFVTQYKTLMSSGVPVVTINSSTPAAQYKVVGTGTTGNSALLNQAAALATASSGSMVVVNGIPGLVPVQVRLDPVVKAITSAHSGLKSLPTIYSGFDVNKATQALSTDLIAHSDLKVIVAADGPDGQAAAAAVQQAGKAGQVTVIALDATPAEVTALKAGTISGLVAQSPQEIGQEQVKELVSYVQAHPGGEAVPVNVGTVSVPQHLLTKSNVDDPASSDWIYKASC